MLLYDVSEWVDIGRETPSQIGENISATSVLTHFDDKFLRHEQARALLLFYQELRLRLSLRDTPEKHTYDHEYGYKDKNENESEIKVIVYNNVKHTAPPTWRQWLRPSTFSWGRC